MYNIATRAYTEMLEEKPGKVSSSISRRSKPKKVSDYTLVFDTETSVDYSQKLRFGFYQLYHLERLIETGLFIREENLSKNDLKIIHSFIKNNPHIKLLSYTDFIDDIFYEFCYENEGVCVGFNLPFDISRLCYKYNPCRLASMRGGFTLHLSENTFHPAVQIKHLSVRSSLIKFVAQPKFPGSTKNKSFRGRFVDVSTLASAMYSSHWSLDRLAKHLQTPSQKHTTDEHGRLSLQYLVYGLQDVQVTYECYIALKDLYESYHLNTPLHSIYSEASIGKAYLSAMGITPYLKTDNILSPEITGYIMSTYYGGRSEVHVRKTITQIAYCDFLSMYPTVCTLMGLWTFVISNGIHAHSDRYTQESISQFLDTVTVDIMQDKSVWKTLQVIVKIQPDNDIVPIRTKYDLTGNNIGINYCTSNTPLWYTLADCISSKLLTGKTPTVLEAIVFTPADTQDGLSPINITGNSEYHINPLEDDFYKRLIELRSTVKDVIKHTDNPEEKSRLDATQQALKICANATSYGIFVEVNVEQYLQAKEVICYSGNESFHTTSQNVEKPGKFFNPLLSTLITGAARLMLTLAECLANREGLSWVFCDTDSMGLCMGDLSDNSNLYTQVENVTQFFDKLNPYDFKKPKQLFKLEEQNYHWETGILYPLYGYAVSSKRLCMFNIDGATTPVMRKISAHGLGHLLAPYYTHNTDDIPSPVVSLHDLGNVSLWHYDLWYYYIQTELHGNNRISLAGLPRLDIPVVCRYAATTPDLISWFTTYNTGKSINDQVKPFNFLLRLMMKPLSDHNYKPIAIFSKKSSEIYQQVYDRETMIKIPVSELITYSELLDNYHIHPEAKFDNGGYDSVGFTTRKNITVGYVECIGKESNQWEKQFFLGVDINDNIEYGLSRFERSRSMINLRTKLSEYPVTEIARMSGITRSHLYDIIKHNITPHIDTINQLNLAIKSYDEMVENKTTDLLEIIGSLQRKKSGINLKELALSLEIDYSYLCKILHGGVIPSRDIIACLSQLLEGGLISE